MINHLEHEQMFAIHALGGGHCTLFLASIWLDPSLNLGGRGVHPAHHLPFGNPSQQQNSEISICLVYNGQIYLLTYIFLAKKRITILKVHC